MSNKSFTEELQDNIKSGWKSLGVWMDAHDSASWPVFGVFMAVVTAALYFNIEAFAPVVGQIGAISIGAFFEYAIIAWKATVDRKRNDAKQNQIAQWALNISVVLAIGLFVVNVFRVGGEQGFEFISLVIVGAGAFAQVVFFLAYDAANPDKKMTREHGQANREIQRKHQHKDYVIAELQADALIIESVGNELDNLRRRFAHLPPNMLEPLLEAARVKLLGQYTTAENKKAVDEGTRHMADVNGDGKIGGGGVNSKPARPDLYPSHEPVVIASQWSGESFKDIERGKTFTTAPAQEDRELKQLPVDTLFEDDVPQEMPPSGTVANEEPSDNPPDF